MAIQDPIDAAALRHDWDSYGGKPTTAAAIETAQAVRWSPQSSGGMTMVWKAGGHDVEIQIDADGQITGVCFERVG